MVILPKEVSMDLDGDRQEHPRDTKESRHQTGAQWIVRGAEGGRCVQETPRTAGGRPVGTVPAALAKDMLPPPMCADLDGP